MGSDEVTSEVKTTQPLSEGVSPGIERGSVEISAEAAVKAVKAGHAKDVDIAAQIIAEHGHEIGNGWTAEEEKKLMRKIDWRLVPIVGYTHSSYLQICNSDGTTALHRRNHVWP